MEDLWYNFRLVTPFSSDKLKCIDFESYDRLSLSATSLVNIMYDRKYDNPIVQGKFDRITIYNISNFFNDIEHDFPEYENTHECEQSNLQTISNMIFNEDFILDEINNLYDIDSYPITYLFCGILCLNNWKYLSDEDFIKFVDGYGISREEKKENQIQSIIQIQNDMFREIITNGYFKKIREIYWSRHL